MIPDYELTTGQQILPVASCNFAKYGAVLDYDASTAIAYINENIPLPQNGNGYVANEPPLEKIQFVSDICRDVFAELPVQAGWCVGNLTKMNGMEWHKSSEVVVACTDMVLLLGSFNDINNDIYDSAKAEAFYLPKGTVVELYAFTLHLAPLNMGGGFKSIIILPKGTNLPLESGINGTLRAVNKWLLVHKEHTVGISLGGKIGVIGTNTALVGKQ